MTKINLFQGSSNEENIPFPGGAALEEKKTFPGGSQALRKIHLFAHLLNLIKIGPKAGHNKNRAKAGRPAMYKRLFFIHVIN